MNTIAVYYIAGGFMLLASLIAAICYIALKRTTKVATPAPAALPVGSPAAAAAAAAATGTASNGMETAQPTRIEKRSPEELQQIAARYHLKITGKAGNTWDRLIFYTVCQSMLLTCSMLLVSLLPSPVWVRLLLTFSLMLVAGGSTTWQFFLVDVPKLVAATALNSFGGRVHIFLPGWNIRFPWEQVNANDFISLRSGVTQRKITTPTKDGLTATFENPMLRWRVFPPLLLVNSSHSTETIDKAATDIFESVVREEVGDVEMNDLSGKLSKVQLALVRELEGVEKHGDEDTEQPKHQDVHRSTFEEQYGLTAEIVALGAVTYPVDYREAREGAVTMKIFRETAKANVEASRPSPDQEPTTDFGTQLDNAMLNAKEGVKKNIDVFRIETNPEASETARHLGQAAKNVGPLVAAAANTLGKRRKPQTKKGDH